MGADDSGNDTVESRLRADNAGFVEQLRRRGVLEVALGYLVSGWLLLQISDVTFDKLSLPSWVGTFVAYLVITGFPIALVLAWFIDVTSKGIVFADEPPAPRPRGIFTKTYIAIVGALALAAVGVFVFDRYVGLPDGSAAVAADSDGPSVRLPVVPNSIAVLPFLNIDGTEEARIFSDGLAEDLIDRLANVPSLRVSSRGDAFSLAPNSASRDVRERLRVAYYIEGSVRLSEDELRIAVQLIDSATGFHISSRTFNRLPDDFFEIQREMTNLIVASLRVALPEDTQLDIETAADAVELDAYIQYRRGMEILHQPLARDSMAEALAFFEQSLAIDPDYAAAHAGICMTYSSGYAVTFDPAHIEAAKSACAAALVLNANLNVVHDALGDLSLSTGEPADAERAFERALAINPNDVTALIGLGNSLLGRQMLTEAEEQFRRAIGLQPGNWRPYDQLGRFLFMNGRYGEAAAQYREVVSLDGRNFSGWTSLAGASMLAGNFSDAARAFERALEIRATSLTYANLGLMHYYLGDFDAAVAALERAVEMEPNDFFAWSNLGDVLSFAGDSERARLAFVTAERGAEQRLEIDDTDVETLMTLAWIRAMLGDHDSAERLLTRARAAAARNPYVYFTDALVSARRNDVDAALAKLETAVEMGYPRAFIAAEPHLTGLRGDRRFAALVGE